MNEMISKYALGQLTFGEIWDRIVMEEPGVEIGMRYDHKVYDFEGWEKRKDGVRFEAASGNPSRAHFVTAEFEDKFKIISGDIVIPQDEFCQEIRISIRNSPRATNILSSIERLSLEQN